MIITKKLQIKINNGQQIQHYRSNGFDVKYGDNIEIDVNLLPKGSCFRVDVECDICGSKRNLAYRDYITCLRNQNIYCCLKCSEIKKHNTNLKKFGVISPLQNKDILKKQQNTCLEKYGFITNLKCEDTKDKIKKTCLKRYDVDNYAKTNESKEKVKLTCLEKYGEESYPKTKEYKQKVREVNLEKNKCEYYFQSEEFKMKSEKTQIKRYSVSKYTNPEKNKETCLERYGCEYVLQNPEIFKKQQLSGYKIKRYEDLYYQGTYELDFLMNFYDKLKIEKPKSIKYNYNNETKVYFPDFYLPEYNLIVEIKSKYTYELHKELNECKKLSVLERGYNFIFIIDKNYIDFIKFISNPEYLFQKDNPIH